MIPQQYSTNGYCDRKVSRTIKKLIATDICEIIMIAGKGSKSTFVSGRCEKILGLAIRVMGRKRHVARRMGEWENKET